VKRTLLLVALAACGTHAGRATGPGTNEPTPSAKIADAAPPAVKVTAPPGTAEPYRLATDTARGSIDGAVLLATQPPRAALDPPSTKTACGGAGAPRVVLAPGGNGLIGVVGAFVWIDKMPRGDAPDPAAPAVEVSFDSCRFAPRAVVLPRLGGSLAIANDDDIRHEPTVDRVAADGTRTKVARIPMPLSGQRYEVMIDAPGLIEVGCALHADEHAWAYAPPTPYVAATGADGRFHLGKVPPGTYHLVAWHPPIIDGGQPLRAEADVTVTADTAADITLSLQ
jgi:hypothetical protein